jgi:hypothetical protein
MLIQQGNLRNRLWPIIGLYSETLTKVLAFYLCAALEMNVIHMTLFQYRTPCSLVEMCRNKHFDIPDYNNRQISWRFLFLWPNDPTRTQTALLLRFLDHTHAHTHTRTHTQQDFSERVISQSQRPLPTQHTTNTRNEHKCPQRDSNPRSQRSDSFRPTFQIG